MADKLTNALLPIIPLIMIGIFIYYMLHFLDPMLDSFISFFPDPEKGEKALKVISRLVRLFIVIGVLAWWRGRKANKKNKEDSNAKH
jgi:preprotein translocase subunit YajC